MSNWFSGLQRIGRIATLSCVSLAAFLAVAHAQSFGITPVTTNTVSKASFPSMVTDSKGSLNLVWIDSVKGLQFSRSSSSANGTSFGNPPAITTINGPDGKPVSPSFQPQLAVYPTQENVIEITWASFDATSTTAAPLYDIWAARSHDGGANFVTPSTMIAGPVALFDGPRVAFDSTGKTDIVWGRNNVWIWQAQDGVNVSTPPTPLMLPNTPIDTGGPRIAVTADGRILVVWTDEVAKDNAKPGDGNFCTDKTTDSSNRVTNTFGGNVWINETLPNQDPNVPVILSPGNTRRLSNTDWQAPNSNPQFSLNLGFYGCSYDNISIFLDVSGRPHLLWSDDSPDEDVLTSEFHGTYPAGTQFAGLTQFSFPINLASMPAASPQVAVDKAGTFYVVWSGGPTGGPNSPGIYYIRSDDGGSTFTSCAQGQPLCGAINVAPKGSGSPAFPQVAVDSNSNVNIAWEQPTAALKNDGTDMFNVFFARSTDKQTFPSVLQVTASPSTLCFEPPPPPEGTGLPPVTPDVSTCGTVQLGVDANSTPDMVWVNQASGAAVADIDFATSTFPTGTITPSTANLTATNTSAKFTVAVNGFSSPITFSCLDADKNAPLPSWLACSFSPQPLDPAQSNTDTLTITRQGTPTSSLLLSPPTSRSLPEFGPPMVWSMGFATICLMAVLMLATGRRRDFSRALVLRGFFVMTLTVVLAVGLVSCGGSTSSPATSTSGTTGTTGTGGTGGTSGTGGTGGGSSITVHVAVQAQSGGTTTTLGTVTITAQ